MPHLLYPNSWILYCFRAINMYSYGTGLQYISIHLPKQLWIISLVLHLHTMWENVDEGEWAIK